MSVNVLLDREDEPTDERVRQTLGAAAPLLDQILASTTTCEQDWKYYGKKYGWKLKVHADSKTLLEITLADGWFLASTAIRGQELDSLRADPEGAALLAAIPDGATAAEGYGLKIEVHDQQGCDLALRLAAFILGQRKAG